MRPSECGRSEARSARELSGTGLEITAEQWHILILLRHRNGQTQKELARRLYKDKTTIAKLVAGMESSGMVDRKPGLKDRREKKVFLTEKGVEVMDGVTATVQKVTGLVEAGIDGKERALCRDVLRRVHRKLNSINGIHTER